MIEVSFANGATARFSLSAEIWTSLPTRRCEGCDVYFVGPGQLLRGPQGRTVIVCVRCKAAQS